VGETAGASASAGVVTVEGFHHYTISVADLEESIAWYSRVVGFKLVYANKSHRWGKVAYMQGPGFLLEMFQVANPKPVPPYTAGPEPDTDLSVCGHKHMALLHDSVLEGIDELNALGADVRATKTVKFEGVEEFYAVFFADNTGGLIELPEDGPPPGGRPPRDTSKQYGDKPLGAKALHHVAICFPEREEAIDWYSRIFGFTVAKRFEVPHVGLVSGMMQAPGFWMEVHSIAGGGPVPPERRTPSVDVQTLGNKYFALGVRDLGVAAGQLEKAGVEIIEEDVSGAVRRLFIRDFAGNPLELFQLMN
jgi:catechol 2,3-dioxygenase-like lactoylglutathione lyase family enzyme